MNNENAIGSILGTLVYLAIGLAVFMWLGDPAVFSWVDPWLYVYALLWPFIFFYYFLKWAVIAVVVIVIVAIGVRLGSR